MKTNNLLLLGAVAVGLWMFSKKTEAFTSPGIPGGYGGGIAPQTTPPNLPPGEDDISKLVKYAQQNPAVGLQDTNYELIRKSDPAWKFAGSFSLAELQQLTTGLPVVQGTTTTKVEEILTTTVAGSGGRPTMSTQVLQVSQPSRDSSGMTAMDRQIASNFAAQGKANPYAKKK